MGAVYFIIGWLVLAVLFGFIIGRCISFGNGDNSGSAE